MVLRVAVSSAFVNRFSRSVFLLHLRRILLFISRCFQHWSAVVLSLYTHSATIHPFGVAELLLPLSNFTFFTITMLFDVSFTSRKSLVNSFNPTCVVITLSYQFMVLYFNHKDISVECIHHLNFFPLYSLVMSTALCVAACAE